MFGFSVIRGGLAGRKPSAVKIRYERTLINIGLVLVFARSRAPTPMVETDRATAACVIMRDTAVPGKRRKPTLYVAVRIVPREILEQAAGFDEAMQRFEDTDMGPHIQDDEIWSHIRPHAGQG